MCTSFLWHKSNNSFKPEGHYNTEEFNQSSLIKWIIANNYSFTPIPKRKGKTRRNSSLLRTHHQDISATKHYEITLQSYMIHLWDRAITTKEISTKTIFHCQMYIKKGYVCSFSTKLHVIFKNISEVWSSYDFSSQFIYWSWTSNERKWYFQLYTIAIQCNTGRNKMFSLYLSCSCAQQICCQICAPFRN